MSQSGYFSVYDAIEQEITIENKQWDDPTVNMLWARHMLICDQMRNYWSSYISRGKKCFDYEKGNIFTEEQKRYMEEIEKKQPVEPRLVEQRIYALIGQILKGRRSGSITTEGGSLNSPSDSSKAVELANIVLKDMEVKFKERRLEKELLHDGLVSSYMVWAWIEKGLPSKGEGVLRAKLLPWDSVAVAPFNFRKPEDITCVAFKWHAKEADLIDMYPDMEEQIKRHPQDLRNKDSEQITSVSEFESGISASDRSAVSSIAASSFANASTPSGFYEMWTRVFQVKKKEKIAINLLNPKDFHVRPPEWDESRWQSFLTIREQKYNVKYTETVRPVIVLWQTVGSTSGLMVENKMHWFQEDGAMPGVPFWATMIDGDLMGPGEKMINNVLKAACAETEFLDEVMKGSGSIWILRNGYIENINSFQQEVSRNNGVLSVKGDFPGTLDQVAMHIQRKPNPATLEYSQKVKYDIEEETRISSAVMGNIGREKQDQSGVAKSMEITQGMVAQSEYIENFNNWWEAFQDLKCKLIPYGYTEYDVLDIVDEKSGETIRAEINAPQYDITGEVVGLVNDLSAHVFRFKLQAVDDSPTAKAELQRQAIIFLNSVPGPLATIDPSGELLAHFMMAMPNSILQEAGKRLLAKAQQNAQLQQQNNQTEMMIQANEKMLKLKNEAEKIKNSKVAVSLTGEQLMQFPELARLLQDVGYFDKNAEQPTQEQPVNETQTNENQVPEEAVPVNQ
jgi:hypothetical protein